MKLVKLVVIPTFLILLDLAVYTILTLLMMAYDKSKGESWSAAKVGVAERATVIGMHTWHVVNLLAVGYLIYRFLRDFNKDDVS